MRFKDFILLLSALAFAEPMTLAVSDLEPRGPSSDEALIISDRLREEILLTGSFRVMERGMMQNILKEQGLQQTGACSNSECQVQVGRLLGVDRLVVGTVGKLGSLYTLSIRLLNVETGEIMLSVSQDQKGGIEDLLGGPLKRIAAQLSEAVKAKSAVGPAVAPPVAVTTNQAQVAAPVATSSSSVAISSSSAMASSSSQALEQNMTQVAKADSAKVAAQVAAKDGAPKAGMGVKGWTRIGLVTGAALFSGAGIYFNKKMVDDNSDIKKWKTQYDRVSPLNPLHQDLTMVYRTSGNAAQANLDKHMRFRNASYALAISMWIGFGVTFAF